MFLDILYILLRRKLAVVTVSLHTSVWFGILIDHIEQKSRGSDDSLLPTMLLPI